MGEKQLSASEYGYCDVPLVAFLSRQTVGFLKQNLAALKVSLVEESTTELSRGDLHSDRVVQLVCQLER